MKTDDANETLERLLRVVIIFPYGNNDIDGIASFFEVQQQTAVIFVQDEEECHAVNAVQADKTRRSMLYAWLDYKREEKTK